MKTLPLLIFLNFVLIACQPSDNINDPTGDLPISEDFTDLNQWFKSDGYSNNGAFSCDWSGANATATGGEVTLTLNNTPGATKSYSCAEISSKTKQSYGRYEARIMPAKQDGIVTAFFVYTNSPQWDEIDIEFLGKDTTKVQFNYFVGGIGEHEYLYDLGFDASLSYHTYAIKWEAGKITWYVDNVGVHSVTASHFYPTPSNPANVFFSIWNGTGVDSWLNPFVYSVPLTAKIDSFSFQ